MCTFYRANFMLPIGSLSKNSSELREKNPLSTYFLCSILLKLSSQTDPSRSAKDTSASARFVLFDDYKGKSFLQDLVNKISDKGIRTNRQSVITTCAALSSKLQSRCSCV